MEAVAATAKEVEEAVVAEGLELLADFGADIAVRGMETGEGGFEGVGVGEEKGLRWMAGGANI